MFSYAKCCKMAIMAVNWIVNVYGLPNSAEVARSMGAIYVNVKYFLLRPCRGQCLLVRLNKISNKALKPSRFQYQINQYCYSQLRDILSLGSGY